MVLIVDHSHDKCSICKFFKKGKCIIDCVPGDGLCWDKECILEVK